MWPMQQRSAPADCDLPAHEHRMLESIERGGESTFRELVFHELPPQREGTQPSSQLAHTLPELGGGVAVASEVGAGSGVLGSESQTGLYAAWLHLSTVRAVHVAFLLCRARRA